LKLLIVTQNLNSSPIYHHDDTPGSVLLSSVMLQSTSYYRCLCGGFDSSHSLPSSFWGNSWPITSDIL